MVDANVVASKTLLDWLFHLKRCSNGAFSLVITPDISVEALRAMRRRYPKADGRLVSKRMQLIRVLFDEEYETFSGSIPFTGFDKHDYHVHAAAVEAGTDYLLTCNDAGDFSSDPDNEHYEIIHPDDFFMLVTDSNPACCISATQGQLAYWSERPYSVPLDEQLRKAECPQFADRVRKTLQQIARFH